MAGMYGLMKRAPATSTKRGTVKQMPAIANLAGAPSQADFNGLLQKLRDAGVLAT